MLPYYRTKLNIAGVVCGATMGVGVALGSFIPEAMNSILGPVFGLTTGISFWYACWAVAKAKGYSGWIGMTLPFLSIIGLIILAALDDKHKSVDGA
jgi:hypothetical protein